MTRYKTATISASIGFIGAAIVMLFSVFRSTSSTAAIGVFFIPVYAAPVTVLFYIFGYALPDLIKWLKRETSELPPLMKLRAVFAAVLLFSGITYVAYGIALTNTVGQLRLLSEPGINDFLRGSIFKNNKYALGALAQNPNAQEAVLAKIAQQPDLVLHRKMWSIWPVMEGNGKGLAVMRLVAMHNNVSTETLARLAKSPDEYVRSTVAGNEKTPVAIIRQFFDKGGYLMEWGVAANNNAPADILMELSRSENEYTRSAIARNSNTPVAVLAYLANDPVWNVRGNVALNHHASVETLENLSGDTNNDVRRYVAMNPQASVKILERLGGDAEELIRYTAKRTLNEK